MRSSRSSGRARRSFFNVYEKAVAGFAAQVAAQDTTPLILPRGIG